MCEGERFASETPFTLFYLPAVLFAGVLFFFVFLFLSFPVSFFEFYLRV